MSSATIPFIEALESTITRTKSSLSAATVPTVQRPESLPFTCSTTQTFAQLALRQSITWTQVDAALELHFSHLVVGVVASDPTSASSSSSSSSWAIAAAGELVTLSSAIQGEFGLALVCRVLRRFVGYEDLNEERRCIDWCRKLERAVAAFESTVLTGSLRSRGRERWQGLADVDTERTIRNEFKTPAKRALEDLGRLQQSSISTSASGSSPSISSSAAPMSAAGQPTSSPATSLVVPLSTPQDDLESGHTPDGFLKAKKIRSSSSGSSSGGIHVDKDKRYPDGRLVLAKMLEPRDKTLLFPSMVFPIEHAPEGVVGRKVATTYLVSPLTHSVEWHWIAPSRLRAFPTEVARIDKLATEIDAALEEAHHDLDVAKMVNDADAQRVVQCRVASLTEAHTAWAIARDASELTQWRQERFDELGAQVPQDERRDCDDADEQDFVVVGSKSGQGDEQDSEATQDDTNVCVCKRPYDSSQLVIGCDNEMCKIQWYHPDCINFQGSLDAEESWTCPYCDEERLG